MIKHLLICDFEGKREYYMCNHACSTTKEKSVKKKEQVTCKNCLRQLKRKNPYCTLLKFKVVEEI